MFSCRTRWDPTSNPLATAVQRRLSLGLPLFDLTESNPTRVGLGFPREALIAALAHPESSSYDPQPFGLPSARQAIARYYQARGIDAHAGQIVITSSTSEAYAYLFKLLADPGDEILVPQPSYPLFEYLAGLESIGTVPYPLRYDGEWHLGREGVRAAAGPRTRAIVAVSPNNPTGSYLKADELAFLTAFCRERGLALLCDEVFADYPLGDGASSTPSVLAQHNGALVFALSGASKVAALPQLKIGWLATGGPAELVAPALERLEIIADTYLSASTPAQLALPQVLEHRALAQEPIRRRLALNMMAARAHFGLASAWQPLRVEGGWSVVLRVPGRRSELEWALALVEEEGVLVHPGFFFDFASEAYVVLSLLVEPAVFREGLMRITRRFDAT